MSHMSTVAVSKQVDQVRLRKDYIGEGGGDQDRVTVDAGTIGVVRLVSGDEYVDFSAGGICITAYRSSSHEIL